MATFMMNMVRCCETAIKSFWLRIFKPISSLRFLLILSAICIEKKLSVELQLALR